MTIFLAACMTVVLTIPKPPVDADAVLVACIVEVERDTPRSRAGMTVAAGWPKVTPRQRLAQIREEVTRKGYVPTPYLLALCYNAGVARVEAHEERARHRDYADRVRNLFEERMAATKDK